MRNYKELISEDVQTLLELERQQKHAKLRDRVRMLRLLKSGEARSLPVVAGMLGISSTNARYLWNNYQQQGLLEFTRWRYGGNYRKLTVEQQQQLVAAAAEAPNSFGSQADIRQYILQTFQVNYTQPGISYLCSRNKIKHKVGRPRNKEASEEQQQDYKKNSRRP